MRLGKVWVLASLLGPLGCGANSSSNAPTPCSGAKCDDAESFNHQWAVDMTKVRTHYGKSSKYFFGLDPQEASIPPGLPGSDQIVWDQTMQFESNHMPHKDKNSDPSIAENVQVIMEDGSRVDPPGYVNIVPLLRDTDPAKQTALRTVMKNGDIIVYFHPEYTAMDDIIERRASHVAMHYDFTDPATGKEHVHHIDNPDGYGPRYNHRPDRRMPFHVFRFKPSSTAKFGKPGSVAMMTIDGVAFTAGQIAAVLSIVNNAPEADLDGKYGLDKRAAQNIVGLRQQGPIGSLDRVAELPYVGASALTKLRDAVVADSNEAGELFSVTADQARRYGDQARAWAFMNNNLSPFQDFFTLNMEKKEDLVTFATATIEGRNLPGLYCSGLAYTNLHLALNMPLNEAGLGADLWGKFQAGSYRFDDLERDVVFGELKDDTGLKSIDRLIFEPYTATDILNNWVDVAFKSIPMPVRQQLLAQPAVLEQIVGGFRQLAWSDEAAGKDGGGGQLPVATVENASRWAKAYGRGKAETDAYLAADPELRTLFASLDLASTDLTPMDVLRAVERKQISNQFVPPRIWIDDANKPDSSLVYVATVLNCELLTAVDGSGKDACSGGGGGVNEFGEGAAETSTYDHYRVTNGGERTHRRFDASAGPDKAGKGTKVTMSFTHGDVSDLVFLLHTPDMWPGHESDVMSMMEYDRFCTTKNPAATCAPEKGILLTVPLSGSVSSGSVDVDLLDVCSIKDEDSLTCPVTRRSNALATEMLDVSRQSRGKWGLTMLDRGQVATGEALDRCSTCAEGGGQFNQWKLLVRNDQ